MTDFIETEIGKIPSYWSIDKLENHLLIKGRIGWKNLKVSEYVSEGPYIVGGLQIKELGIDWEECAHVTEARYEESPEIMLKNEDILMTKDGTIGKLALVDALKYKATVASHIHVIRRASDKIISKFLFYFFKSPVFGQIIESKITGSVIPALTQFDINNTYFPIPPLEEQNSIASVLGCLDDKIHLLHRQNTTLERMAETLFRQWFVEEAQEGWEEVTLGEVATVQNGYAFSSGDYVEYQEGFLEVFKMGHIQPGGGLRFNPKADFVPRTEKLKRWTLNKNDIVMAMTDMKDNMGILGHPALIDASDKYVLNQRVARIYLETTEKLKSIYLLYLQLNTEEAISLLQSKANSGVQVNLTTEAIKSIPVSLPPKFVQEKVLSNIEPIFDKLSSNRLAVKTLEKLRDNLLPKLMSGEIRINND